LERKKEKDWGRGICVNRYRGELDNVAAGKSTGPRKIRAAQRKRLAMPLEWEGRRRGSVICPARPEKKGGMGCALVDEAMPCEWIHLNEPNCAKEKVGWRAWELESATDDGGHSTAVIIERRTERQSAERRGAQNGNAWRRSRRKKIPARDARRG